MHTKVSRCAHVQGERFPFAIPRLLVLKMVSEDSKAFPAATSCMGFSGALLDRGSFFISFFISCEDREREGSVYSLKFWGASSSLWKWTIIMPHKHSTIFGRHRCLNFHNFLLIFFKEIPSPIEWNNAQYSKGYLIWLGPFHMNIKRMTEM